MTQRTLSFGETTYNLANELSIEMTVPKNFFGSDKEDASNKTDPGTNSLGAEADGHEEDDENHDDGDDDDDDDDDGDDDDKEHEKSEWI